MAGHGAAADVLVAGDFNCKLPGPEGAGPGDGQVRPDALSLQSLMAAAGLADVWASLRSGAAAAAAGGQQDEPYTFVSRSSHPHTTHRLDYWFAPSDLVAAGWAPRCVHRWDAGPSDHAAVELAWCCPEATPKGRWRWCFPDSLLRDAGFVAGTLSALRPFVQQWQPDSPEEAAAPARSRWEAVKLWLRTRAHQALRLQSEQRAAARKQAAVKERLARGAMVGAAAQHGAAAHQQWRAAARGLARATAAESAEGGAQPLPLDVLWETYGEQSTKWFYQLMPRAVGEGPVGGITSVRHHDQPGGQEVAHSVHDPGGVAKVGDLLSAYFDGQAGGLFAPGNVSVAAQDLLRAAVDRFVPAEEALHCMGPSLDGTVTLACLAAALEGTAGGKAPGSDGLSFEVYKVFWEALSQPLADCFNEAFSASPDGPLLAASQRQGVITLIHKGGGKPADVVAAYRPITLLNTDVKLLARVMVARLAPALEAVIDPTQTAFLPGRWIGDNVLFHLEEIDFCQQEKVPACVVFLDFEKAYDRLDRGWLFRCIDRLGFPPAVSRWVGLLLRGATAGVMYHGYLSPWVQVLSGVAQGSPLSPPLYLIAAQPLAARLRQLQAQGLVDALMLPGGVPAPPCQQHADDTTLHARTPEGALAALNLAVHPFSEASNARLNVAKSHGMLLGVEATAAARAAAEALVGVPFGDPKGHQRHLGILLSAEDQEAATKVMFAKRRAGVYLRVTSWARFDLSYLGRLHVAKQVLASTLYYHATFVPPPPGVLQQIVECVDRFVEFGRLLEHGTAVPLRKVPSAAVESLPAALGGLRRADVPAQVMALHAKVAAALLHPRQHPWKRLMRRAFERLAPGLGPAALVSTMVRPSLVGAARGAGFGRLVAYWSALKAMQPHRLVAPELLPAHHVLGERLLRNAQVLGPNGRDPVLEQLPGRLAALDGFQPTLGGLRAALVADDDRAVEAARRLFECVPEGWQQHVAPGPLRAPQWLVSGCGQWVRRGRPPPPSAPGAAPQQVVFSVRPDGRLGPVLGPLPQHLQAVPSPAWRVACVAWCPVVKGQQRLADVAPGRHLHSIGTFGADNKAPLQAYLLGAWGDGGVWVDPNVWGLGKMPLSHFVVKHAAQRLIVLGMCRSKAGFVPSEGVRPPLFAAPGKADTGLAAVEERQVALYGARWATLQGPSAGARRVRQRTEEDERGCCPLYVAAWMRQSVERILPLERAAAARVALAAAEGSQGRQRIDDCRDVLEWFDATRAHAWPVGQGIPPWRRAYGDLRLKRLDRPLKFFGWLLAHGALCCGAAMVGWTAAPDQGTFEGMCACGAEGFSLPAALPAGQPPPCETLSHVFLDCPVVRPAVSWLRTLWRKMAGVEPPLDARVIVVGDRSVWSPDEGQGCVKWEVWTHLRLAFCRAVWALTARRARAGGPQFTAAAVVAMVAAALERALRRDWLRVWVDPVGFAELPSWCQLSVRRVRLDLSVFEERWLLGGVLAHLDGGGQGALLVHVPRGWDAGGAGG